MSGQIFQLVCGDCLDLLPKLASNSVDMVLCDLPYGTTRNAWDSVIPLDALWREYRRVSKPNAAIILTAQMPFTVVMGASNLGELRYEWIWEKTEATGHLNAQRAPLKAHESALVFYREQPTYNPQKTTGHVRKSSSGSKGGSTNYGEVRGVKAYDSTDRFPRSVIVLPTDKQKAALHPTQKPVGLMAYFIRTYSNPGDVVLDTCMGSGTTGVAALQEGRRFIGMERDPAYFTLAQHRIENDAGLFGTGSAA